MIIVSWFLVLFSFILIWTGSGLIIDSVKKYSTSTKLSSFFIAFILLGMLTSLSDAALGFNSILVNEPAFFVGNLIGGIILLFLFIIPLLAIVGNGIVLKTNFNRNVIPWILVAVSVPVISLYSGMILYFGGVISILVYFILVYFSSKHIGLNDQSSTNLSGIKMQSAEIRNNLPKILLGVGLILFSSYFIVGRVSFFADHYQWNGFYVGLFFLTLGTNLPEIFVGTRAFLAGQKYLAFGLYLGSAVANILLFGVFSILAYVWKTDLKIDFDVAPVFTAMAVGLALFYVFTRSKNDISRSEGVVLMTVYVVYVLYELLLIQYL